MRLSSMRCCAWRSQRGPIHEKPLFSGRVVEVKTYEEYQYQQSRIYTSPGAFSVVFFKSKSSVACQNLHRVVHNVVGKYEGVTFLTVDVEEPDVEEILKKHRVPLLPTFYFYKAGFVVGRLAGSSTEIKLEQLVESFINHKKLREYIKENDF